MSNNKLAKVFHFDLQGKRDDKYNFLNQNSLASIDWNTLEPNEPNFFFVKKDNTGSEDYEIGFKIEELFVLNNSGVATEFDDFAIRYNKEECLKQIEDLKYKNEHEIIKEYNLPEKSLNKVKNSIIDIKSNNNHVICPISYRPFDTRFCIYTGKANGIMARPRRDVMPHMIKENFGLCFSRIVVGDIDWRDIFIINRIVEKGIMAMRVSNNAPLFPLYIYPETTGLLTIDKNTTERIPNLNQEIVDKIAEGLGARFLAEKELRGFKNLDGMPEDNTFAPIDILDYIYAVLHSPTYREKYKEFLKIDFPRVPYPKDVATFWQLVKLGGEIRQIHLLESSTVEKYITQYPEDGDNFVIKPIYKNGNVYINEKQYFANVPQIAWDFYIGGYQPAQKWLKDRKGRTLEFEDILHYQKIIVALSETDRLMKEIDKIEIL